MARFGRQRKKMIEIFMDGWEEGASEGWQSKWWAVSILYERAVMTCHATCDINVLLQWSYACSLICHQQQRTESSSLPGHWQTAFSLFSPNWNTVQVHSKAGLIGRVSRHNHHLHHYPSLLLFYNPIQPDEHYVLSFQTRVAERPSIGLFRDAYYIQSSLWISSSLQCSFYPTPVWIERSLLHHVLTPFLSLSLCRPRSCFHSSM